MFQSKTLLLLLNILYITIGCNYIEIICQLRRNPLWNRCAFIMNTFNDRAQEVLGN